MPAWAFIVRRTPMRADRVQARPVAPLSPPSSGNCRLSLAATAATDRARHSPRDNPRDTRRTVRLLREAQARLRRVRACQATSRGCSPESVTYRHGLTAVLLIHPTPTASTPYRTAAAMAHGRARVAGAKRMATTRCCVSRCAAMPIPGRRRRAGLRCHGSARRLRLAG